MERDREKFREATGWTLLVNGQTADAAGRGTADVVMQRSGTAGLPEDFFVPRDIQTEMAEQNLAFFCIDQTFEELPHRPDKKSLKTDQEGKYLELAFVSPMIGRQYQDVLQGLADQIGWRIHIADKVNQNMLFQTVQMLCMKCGITLLKNPSYLPERKSVQLKTNGLEDEGQRRRVEEEFLRQTGCDCIFSI